MCGLPSDDSDQTLSGSRLCGSKFHRRAIPERRKRKGESIRVKTSRAGPHPMRRLVRRHRVSAVTRVQHGSNADRFPPAPSLSRRGDPSRAIRPSTITIASVVVPVVLGFVLVPIGFGLATACTDLAGNGGLAVAPCSAVDHGIKLGVILEGVIWLAASVAA